MKQKLFALFNKTVRPGFTLITIIIALAGNSLFGQTTGKVAGQVKDKETGEPIIGSNVFLEGTYSGASTDLDGFFTILNIPPGKYNLVVSFVGYRETRVVDVEIRVNFTTTIDVNLESELIESSTIVVTAEKPMVEKDRTGARVVVSASEIDILPVTNFDAVVGLQAGVVNGRFRGSRSNEILYMIDGVPVNSAATGGRGATVGIEGVQNLEVISGTFNAEYGRVMSGVVNAITKSGSKELRGNLELYSGNYYSTDKLFGNEIYPSNSSFSLDGIVDLRGSLEGPVPFTNNALSFVISGGGSYNNGYLTGQAENLFETNAVHSTDPVTGDAIFNIRDNVTEEPLNSWAGYDLLTKLIYPLSNTTQLSYSFLLNQGKWKNYSGFWRFTPDGQVTNYSKSMNHIFTTKHQFSSTAFATLNIAYLDEAYDQFLGDVSMFDYLLGEREGPLNDNYLPGAYQQSALATNSNSFAIGGTELFDFTRGSNTLTVKGDYTWQYNQNHEIKTGFEYSAYELENDGKDILFADSTSFQAQLNAGVVDKFKAREIRDDRLGLNVDYQYYNNTAAGNRNPYKRNASQAAAYLQDKMEFSEVVVNAGVRLDYFDPDFKVPKDEMDPDGHFTYPDLTDSEQLKRALKDAETDFKVSPRLGLAYQATTTGVIHFSYGHFYQVPPLENLYSNPKFSVLQGNISSIIMGNANLNPQKTVSYELAYADEISTGIAGEVTVFYRDIYDLLATEVLSTINDQQYARWTNQDYGNVKGVILSMDFRLGSFSSTIDYTYQIAKGNSSDPASTFNRAQGGEPPLLDVIRLNWDQRNTFIATVNYLTPKFAVSAIGRYGSGNPFNYRPVAGDARPTLNGINNGQMPANASLDLNASYLVGEFQGVSMRLYFQAYNLLDARDAAYVFGDTGSPKSTASLERENRIAFEPATFTTPEKIQYDGTSFVSPRQLRLGLGFRF